MGSSELYSALLYQFVHLGIKWEKCFYDVFDGGIESACLARLPTTKMTIPTGSPLEIVLQSIELAPGRYITVGTCAVCDGHDSPVNGHDRESVEWIQKHLKLMECPPPIHQYLHDPLLTTVSVTRCSIVAMPISDEEVLARNYWLSGDDSYDSFDSDDSDDSNDNE